ncbi:MAG TPA: CoA transferase subunit A [Flavobacteriales bacterium]|nr:CoA transferase subunit A [Flavobacteriales bacterium]
MRAFITRNPVFTFVVFTWILQWGLIGVVMLITPEGMHVTEDKTAHMVFRLRLLGPLLVCLAVTYYVEGRKGLGKLFATRQVRKLICSYAGENAQFARQYMAGEVEVEFNPQGTLAERIRAGGAGIPAFYTRTGVGTVIAEGKPLAEFDGKTYLMERGLRADLALVHAWKGDTEGNLVYRMTARNFNPMMASAAALTVAEVERLVEPGQIDPDHIITPGIFVDRIVVVDKVDKRIEQRTVRRRAAPVEE